MLQESARTWQQELSVAEKALGIKLCPPGLLLDPLFQPHLPPATIDTKAYMHIFSPQNFPSKLLGAHVVPLWSTTHTLTLRREENECS